MYYYYVDRNSSQDQVILTTSINHPNRLVKLVAYFIRTLQMNHPIL